MEKSFADEYPKADFNQMIILTLNLIKKFRMNFNSGDGIYIDGANPSFKRALKSQLREDSNYEQLIAFFTRNNPPNRADTEFLTNNMFVIPIAFKNHHKEMLAHCKQLMEYRNGYMAINPKFDKLIVALRTAVEKGEGLLDKEMTSHNDCFDAFRLSLIRWKL